MIPVIGKNHKFSDDIIFGPPYDLTRLQRILETSQEIAIFDHANGYDSNGNYPMLMYINDYAGKLGKKISVNFPIIGSIVLGKNLHIQYPNLEFSDTTGYHLSRLTKDILAVRSHPPIDFKNFLISFNGSAHVSRKLLLTAIHQKKWFRGDYSSKNFTFSTDEVDGHIKDLAGSRERFYRKFFSINDAEFNGSIYQHHYNKHAHEENLKNLSLRLTQSFVHLVSETLATNNNLFGEKPFYSVATRGLFVMYLGPYSHGIFSKMFGFRNFDIFDYRFDKIVDPLDRLLEIVSMLSKFSDLSTNDWHDLYLLESDNIEHNYHHFFSMRWFDYYRDCMQDIDCTKIAID